MELTALVSLLRSSLLDSAQVFVAPDDADFIRHINTAVGDLSHRDGAGLASYIERGELELSAGVSTYPAPENFLRLITCLWGRDKQAVTRPWATDFPRNLPSLRARYLSGVPNLIFDRPPTAAEIASLGATCPIDYVRNTPLADWPDTLTDLVLLRAQAQAALELAMRGLSKPVALRSSAPGASVNGTPAALYELLMREFDRRLR